MKNKFLLLVVAVLMTSAVASAQESRKLLTIEDVVLNYNLSPKSYPVKWVGASDSYSVVDGTSLVAVEAQSGKRRTLITLDEVNELLSTNFKSFPGYAFDDANSLVIGAHGMRNTIGLKERKVLQQNKVPVGANLTRQSGKGGLYAYTKENNLYCFDGEKEYQITNFADKNIVCGQTVSRNEFGIDGGIFPRKFCEARPFR